MAWETRNGKGRYYTRSRRQAGRVVREYIGTGPVAELAAILDQIVQVVRANRAKERKAFLAAVTAAEGKLNEFLNAADVLTRATLRGAGFYQHDRGEWRRAHNVSTVSTAIPVRAAARRRATAEPAVAGRGG